MRTEREKCWPFFPLDKKELIADYEIINYILKPRIKADYMEVYQLDSENSARESFTDSMIEKVRRYKGKWGKIAYSFLKTKKTERLGTKK